MKHSDSLWVNSLEAHTDSLQRKVDLLQAKLDDVQSKTEFLSNVIETANDGVSNQLSAANNLLVFLRLFGINPPDVGETTTSQERVNSLH